MVSIIRKYVRKGRALKRKIKKTVSAERHFYFNIDTPKKANQEKHIVEVEGWVIAKDGSIPDIRIVNNKTSYTPETGIERIDVMKTHGDKFGEKALFSGFSASIEFEDGKIDVEVKYRNMYRKIKSLPVRYGLIKNPSYYYNKDLAWRQAEHQNLIENRKQYFYEEEGDGIQLAAGDPRLMAIYLPQFHPFAENDKAWGKGFTEWTNVTAGQPRFVGHEQPILPSTLGFYDLRLEDKIKEQIDLAKKFGIHGFAFYYYWFSGKKLMDGPIESFRRHKEWDFTYSICWANENWTKRWDGRENDIIIAQEYREEDPLEFIKDVEDILLDKRYLRYEDKLVLTVYRPAHLKDPAHYAKVWRRYFKETHNQDLYLVAVFSFDDKDPRTYGFDAAQDFAPLSAFFKAKLFESGQFPFIPIEDKLIDINFDGVVADYRSIALNKNLIDAYDFKTFPCVTPSWDNDSRKKGKGFVYTNSSPEIYEKWLTNVLEVYMKKEASPIVYLNAWNEWAEGAIMEPTQHLGYATLNHTAKALLDAKAKKTNPKRLAVIIHLFHPELWGVMQEYLERINVPFDIHVSLMDKDIEVDLPFENPNTQIYRYAVPNRGRDVLPFLHILQKVSEMGYESILKIHSKKTKHYTDGDKWLKDLLEGLLPSSGVVLDDIVSKLEQKDTGVIGPQNHIVSLSRHMGSNQATLYDLMSRSLGMKYADEVLANLSKYPYVGGTMFWARVDTLQPLLDLFLLPDDFHSEHGQIDGTPAHAIERLIGVLAQSEGKRLYRIAGDGTEDISGMHFRSKYDFAP